MPKKISLQNEVIRIYKNLIKNKNNPVWIKRNVLVLEKLILNKHFSLPFENKFINSAPIKKILPQLQFFYEVFEVDLENNFVASFLAGKEKLSNYLLHKRFITLIRNEIALAKISKNDYVLFIGNGPHPITAILLNRFAKCKVDCYDKVRQSVVLSRKFVKKLGVSKEIKIYHKRGEALNTDKYSVIIVALLAKPKDKILKKIFNVSKKGTRVVCRTSDGLRQVFYETTPARLLKIYKPKRKTLAEGNQTISSVLLKK